MRKIVSIILCLLVVWIGAAISGCSSSSVTITVRNQYANTLADKMASDKTTDESGNTIYTFDKAKYIEYIDKLMDKVKSEYRATLLDTATYSYLNEDGTQLVVGVEENAYDEDKCKEQAQKIGNIALLYNASTLVHSGKVIVTYENCFTGNELFKIEKEAQ